MVDTLCRQEGADLVVRFNGGAQAGHNVVTPDGRHHTFSQFGSGTFVPGVRTLLGPAFVLHPLALIAEEAHLQQVHVHDAFDRLWVDERACLITPFQQASGRLRELLRADAAHGTCGVGFGECVGDALTHDDVLRARDLRNPSRLRQALIQQQRRKRHELHRAEALTSDAATGEWAWLIDPHAVDVIVEQWQRLQIQVCSADETARHIASAKSVVAEGAQGVLLDETHGFQPHTTWSDCTSHHARRLLNRPATAIGVTRTYSTRHGNGPLPSHDPQWDALPEPHNGDAGWQGAFRRGPLDLPLLEYALKHSPVDVLAVTHADVDLPDSVVVDHYEPGPSITANASSLGDVTPIRRRVREIPAAISQRTGIPIGWISTGPTGDDKQRVS
jgi:adenylosuccinate synthase